ncbi:MAG: thioredoxin family protein, partial [Spirochaetales bacterium]|nr:thioredoxin family protein [Spirochaetales bacterium]
PCLISTGVCKFPQTIKHDYLVKPSSPGISRDIINTGILIGLFILGLIGLLFYLRYKKDIIFTAFLLLIFSGILFYTFIPLDTTEISQADYSRDIAATLCLSCIGIESGTETIMVKSAETKFYGSLTEPVVITVFSAPWCGSCPAAKAYVKELCSLYDTILSCEIVDISLPAEKERYIYYRTIYSFKEPIPLPAIIVSNNTADVFYGTQGLGQGIIQLITKGLHGRH